MEKLIWEQKFNVGNARIDLEHRIFLNLITTIQEKWEENQDYQFIERLITELEYYTRFHFISEENLMIDSEFPDYEQHRDKHFDLLENLNLEKHRLEYGELKLDDFINFLYDWFRNHTANDDLAISEHIKKSGKSFGRPIL